VITVQLFGPERHLEFCVYCLDLVYMCRLYSPTSALRPRATVGTQNTLSVVTVTLLSVDSAIS